MTPEIGVKKPNVLLPKQEIDHNKWAVIACDQFTSEPEYWEEVAEIVGDSPSTYRIILPEVYLGTPEEENRIETTHHHGSIPGIRNFSEHQRFHLCSSESK